MAISIYTHTEYTTLHTPYHTHTHTHKHYHMHTNTHVHICLCVCVLYFLLTSLYHEALAIVLLSVVMS